jgi:hypothetical protein
MKEHDKKLREELCFAATHANAILATIRDAHANACYCNELARLLIEPLIGEMAAITMKLDAILQGVGE